MPTKNPRFTITLSNDLYDKMEDYRFTHRLKSQNQAVLELLEKGIKTMEKEPPPAPKGPREKQEERFMELYASLSDERRAFLEAVVQALIQQG